MLSSVELQNFKAFKHLDHLSIKPITILCGTNSCGKSTILQSILLAKQTIESRQRGQILQMNGRFVRLGMFENLIFDKNTNNKVVLGLSFRVIKDRTRGRQPTGFSSSFLFDRSFPEKVLRMAPAEYHIYFRFTFSLAKRRSPKTHLKPIIVSALELKTEMKTPSGDRYEGTSLSLILDEHDLYHFSWNNLKRRGSKASGSGEAIIRTKFSNLFPENIRIANKPRAESLIPGVNLLMFAYQDFLESEFFSFSYIGPLREEPSRRYVYENEVFEIGNKGENAAFIYLTEGDKRIKNCYFYDDATDTFNRSDDSVRLIDALDKWLNIMNIKGLKSRTISEIISIDLESNSSLKHVKVNIADVGFGVSQIFPIILEGLRMPVGNTLLLEQPEIHLHPNLQMQLADYLISLALSKKNVILETHSDHIINRMVRRMVQEKNINLDDMIDIYFISPAPSGSRFEKINVDSDRGIVNWPSNFFDQTAIEQEKIIRYGLGNRLAKAQ